MKYNLINTIKKEKFRIIIILLITFILIISAAKTYPEGNIKADQSLDEFINHLNSRISILMRDYQIPGLNIALIKEGKLSWTKAYGFADLSENRKMTTATYCRVESISKSVTAWGIMKLVEQGKLDLNKSVKEYIKSWKFPESAFDNQKITASQLLSHTAGLPLGTIGADALYHPEEDLPSLRDTLSSEVIPFQEADKSFYYSDTGYNLLELLVEVITEQDFAEYMKKEILLPLGMNNSSYSWNKEWKPEVPNGYDVNGKAVPVYTYSMKASGNLYSTVDDIAKFVIAGMNSSFTNHQLLKSESIEKMYKPKVEDIPGYYGIVFDAYGFGHYLEWFKNGMKSVSHGGQGTGWMSHFQSVPETGDGIIILTNSQRSWPAFAYILRDWTSWSGFSAAGMEIIITGQIILWGITALFIFISLWKLSFIIEGLIGSRRNFSSEKKIPKVILVSKLVLSLLIIFIVLYAVNLEYQPLYSIFPIASHWFFYSLLSLGIVILLQLFFPVQKNSKFIISKD
jgi:CubicO group peptidase (beta-lactamase class C family)